MGPSDPSLKHGPRSLACVRVFGCLKPKGAMKVKAAPAAEARSRPDWLGASSTNLFHSWEGLSESHARWDPKDGELCLKRVKPEEILLEARSDSDVQIDCRIWV